MRIAPDQLATIVAHARREAPNECVGIVAVRDGTATEVVELTNTEASPFRFDVDGREQLRAITALEDRGDDVGAIYHSHTRSAPEPSQTDLNFAAGWPGVLWIIVGLKGGREDVRTWAVEDGEVREVELEVV